MSLLYVGADLVSALIGFKILLKGRHQVRTYTDDAPKYVDQGVYCTVTISYSISPLGVCT